MGYKIAYALLALLVVWLVLLAAGFPYAALVATIVGLATFFFAPARNIIPRRQ